MGVSEIAKKLNEEDTMTPAIYRRKRKPDNRQYAVITGRWSPAAVKTILRRESYIGVMISNRRLKISPSSKKCIRQTKENWIVIEDNHPPIVSKEEFEKAQKVILNRKPSERKKQIFPLKGLVRCGHCGRIMRRREKGYGYQCNFRYDTDEACRDMQSAAEKDLENMVFRAIILYTESICKTRWKSRHPGRDTLWIWTIKRIIFPYCESGKHRSGQKK